jgi:hypothetical protein
MRPKQNGGSAVYAEVGRTRVLSSNLNFRNRRVWGSVQIQSPDYVAVT